MIRIKSISYRALLEQIERIQADLEEAEYRSNDYYAALDELGFAEREKLRRDRSRFNPYRLKFNCK